MQLAMLAKFVKYIEEQQLFGTSGHAILAVSGGVDSVVLTHLFKRADYSFSIAHCNFHLRGAESDSDEDFVRALASEYEVPFYVEHFQTKEFSTQHKISIQMAARELRYTWLHSLTDDSKNNLIATAHHLDDQLETVLLNLTKGTGISGLRGMLPKTRNIIRPLLFATKEQITEYARDNDLSWHEDSSNKSKKYVRNKLRHDVVPVLKEINPSLSDTFHQTLEKLSAAEDLVQVMIAMFKEDHVSEKNGRIVIKKAGLSKYKCPSFILYEIIKGFGFNYEQSSEVLKSLASVGRFFESSHHRLYVDRNHLIIEAYPESKKVLLSINPEDTLVEFGNRQLHISTIDQPPFEIESDQNIAMFDFFDLRFPLTLRNWYNGDRIVPLGMHHEKKVSDLLIDHKTPLPLKKDVLVLESQGEIAWVVGYRISDKFKIKSATDKVFRLELKTHV